MYLVYNMDNTALQLRRILMLILLINYYATGRYNIILCMMIDDCNVHSLKWYE